MTIFQIYLDVTKWRISITKSTFLVKSPNFMPRIHTNLFKWHQHGLETAKGSKGYKEELPATLLQQKTADRAECVHPTESHWAPACPEKVIKCNVNAAYNTDPYYNNIYIARFYWFLIIIFLILLSYFKHVFNVKKLSNVFTVFAESHIVRFLISMFLQPLHPYSYLSVSLCFLMNNCVVVLTILPSWIISLFLPVN